MKRLLLILLFFVGTPVFAAISTVPTCITPSQYNSGSIYATLNGIQNNSQIFYGSGTVYPNYSNSIAGDTISPSTSMQQGTGGVGDAAASVSNGDVITVFECNIGDSNFGSAGGVIGCVNGGSIVPPQSSATIDVMTTCPAPPAPGLGGFVPVPDATTTFNTLAPWAQGLFGALVIVGILVVALIIGGVLVKYFIDKMKTGVFYATRDRRGKTHLHRYWNQAKGRRQYNVQQRGWTRLP